MSTVRVLYLRTHALATPLLRWATWSPWAHCALVMPDGLSVVDATFAHGVACRELSPIIASASKYAFREIACPDPRAAYGFACSQIGKPYDAWGALGLGFHRDWQSPDRWFCSELVEAAIAAGGNCRFVNNPHRVTPQHSWMVA